jgi:PAS domain-containing protein
MGRSLVNREECAERIRLADEYSRLITNFNVLLDSLKSPFPERNNQIWNATEIARALSQNAWEALEKHVKEHQCGDPRAIHPDADGGIGSSHILAIAALAAVDVILVANDDRRYVDVNEAAAAAMGLSRLEIVGRQVDEFFPEVRGKALPLAWDDFIAEGVQRGTCEMIAGGRRRKFEYHAKANFAPGLHLSVLREMNDQDSR